VAEDASNTLAVSHFRKSVPIMILSKSGGKNIFVPSADCDITIGIVGEMGINQMCRGM